MKRTDKPVLVVGATGKVGRKLTQRLLAKEIPVRAVAREPDVLPAEVRKHPLVDVVRMDLAKPDRVEEAMAGVEAVYLTPPENSANPTVVERDVCRRIVAAAAAENVDQVMLHTWLRPGEVPMGVALIDVKAQVEWELLLANVPFTILRPGIFLETVMDPALQDRVDVFTAPLPPERRVGAVAADDVAQAAAELLAAGRKNHVLDLHIPGGVTGPQVAAAYAATSGRAVEYREYVKSSEEFVDGLSMGAAEKALYAELFRYLREHNYVGQPGAIFQVLPHFAYTDLQAYLGGSRIESRHPPSLETGAPYHS